MPGQARVCSFFTKESFVLWLTALYELSYLFGPEKRVVHPRSENC